MITNEASLRLDILRFPLIVGVVFIHNYDLSVMFQGDRVGGENHSFLVEFVRNLISQGVARVSVPLFFLMAGYLFFLTFKQTLSGYVGKIRTRFKTLFIPFVFWNLAMLTVMAAAQSIPQTAIFFSGRNTLLAQYDGMDFIDAVLGVGRMPIAYHFWFIRDLMILVLISPLIFWLCRYFGVVFILLLLILWLLNSSPLSIPAIDSILFFSFGCWMAICKGDLFALDRNGKTIAVAYIVIVLFDAIYFNSVLGGYIHKVSILFGMVTALWLTRFAVRSELIGKKLAGLAKVSFFVYAAHEPLLTITKKMVFKFLEPQSPYLVVGLYFTLPCIIILLIVSLYSRLLAVCPRLMGAISGGR